ncbi:MAG: fibronectin type III domain-containing protein [Chloroflexi bacterium]|nr:fibronectin type III domain-containing protein [Chloroflexota bacterium]
MVKSILRTCDRLREYLPLTGILLLLFCISCAVSPLTNSGVPAQNDSQSVLASNPDNAQQPSNSTAQSSIGNIQANGITSSSAIIMWSTDKPVSGLVQWGRTTDYEFSSQADGEPAVQQSVSLTGLRPDTTYHYRITLTAQNGVQVTSPDQTFSTLEQLNTRSLVISRIGMLKITGNTAIIAWSTDAPATGQVEYGKTSVYGASTTINGGYIYDHALEVKQLTPGTTYHYRVLSLDKNGNEAVSADQLFSTVDPSDRTAPVISDISITDITHASATISWVTSELASSQIEYDTNVSYSNVTPLDTMLLFNHTVTLDNLSNSKSYHFRITSTDPAGNVSTSPDATLVTSEAPRVMGVMSFDHTKCKCSASSAR